MIKEQGAEVCDGMPLFVHKEGKGYVGKVLGTGDRVPFGRRGGGSANGSRGLRKTTDVVISFSSEPRDP